MFQHRQLFDDAPALLSEGNRDALMEALAEAQRHDVEGTAVLILGADGSVSVARLAERPAEGIANKMFPDWLGISPWAIFTRERHTPKIPQPPKVRPLMTGKFKSRDHRLDTSRMLREATKDL